jgi:hypothetical protein
MSPMSENVRASTSRNRKGLHGLYRENFTSTTFWDVTLYANKFTDVSQECTASVFEVEEYAKKASSIVISYSYSVPTLHVERRVGYWNITLCSPVKVNGHFERTFSLHFQC